MPSNVLLYTLLFFWTLPAVALISFYIYVLVRGDHRNRRTWCRFLPWPSAAPMGLVRKGRRPACTYHRPRGQFPIVERPSGLQGKETVRPRQRGTANHLHVPLVIEDADGGLHMRSWHICLN